VLESDFDPEPTLGDADCIVTACSNQAFDQVPKPLHVGDAPPPLGRFGLRQSSAAAGCSSGRLPGCCHGQPELLTTLGDCRYAGVVEGRVDGSARRRRSQRPSALIPSPEGRGAGGEVTPAPRLDPPLSSPSQIAYSLSLTLGLFHSLSPGISPGFLYESFPANTYGGQKCPANCT